MNRAEIFLFEVGETDLGLRIAELASAVSDGSSVCHFGAEEPEKSPAMRNNRGEIVVELELGFTGRVASSITRASS